MNRLFSALPRCAFAAAFSRWNRLPFGLASVCLLLSLGAMLQDPQTSGVSGSRTWTDRTGKFSTQAELVGVKGDQVELRKPDGTLVTLPLDKLCDADQAFIQAQAAPAPNPAAGATAPTGEAKKPTLSKIRSSEQKLLYAKKIVAAYQDFLAQPGLTDSDRLAAERRVTELSPEAARDALMIGKNFLLLNEVVTLRNESDTAIDELLKNLSGKDGEEVFKLLKAIARKDPISCRANFLLGMGFAITARNYDLAMDEFQECVRRLEDFGSLCVADSDKALAAMYNNLAVLQVRRGYLDAALKLWENAAGEATTLPNPLTENFVHQAVFMNGAVASNGTAFFTSPEPTTLTRYRKFAEKIGVKEDRIRTHQQHGWQYLNLQQQPQDADLAKLNVSLVDEACLNCNGTSVVLCKKCGGDGTVMGVSKSVKRLPTGDYKILSTSVPEKCGACNGGSNPCRVCNDGVERLPF